MVVIFQINKGTRMAKKKLDIDHSVIARKVLDGLWREAHLKGRCWGPRRKDNPYAGTNITIVIDNQLVSISYNGKLVIHEFVRTKNTILGRKIRKLLRSHKLLL